MLSVWWTVCGSGGHFVYAAAAVAGGDVELRIFRGVLLVLYDILRGI